MKKRLIIFWSVLCFTTTCSKTYASELPSAQSVLARCGGQFAGSAPAFNYYAEGTLTAGDTRRDSGAVLYQIKGIDKFRAEFNFSSGQESTIVNRGVGHRVHGNVRSKQAAWITDYFLPEVVPQLFCTENLGPNLKATSVGLESVSGRSVVRIAIHRKATGRPTDDIDYLASEVDLFIDADSFQVLKIKTWAFSPETPDNRSVFEIFLSDYRDVNGILLPFHISHYSNGQKLDDVVLNSVRTDQPLSDSLFE